jgi:hypothetical protein
MIRRGVEHQGDEFADALGFERPVDLLAGVQWPVAAFGRAVEIDLGVEVGAQGQAGFTRTCRAGDVFSKVHA